MHTRQTISRDRAAAGTVDLHLAFLGRLGIDLPAGARILDFGCGAGDAVALLCDRGFDCRGVDIGRHWLTDWAADPALIGRVRLLDLDDYRLPFPDSYFDFCFSDQVFEHVADSAAAFAEVARVLKPGAVSLHRFPGPNQLFEGHVKLPLPWLCRRPSYLGLWALLGRRAPDQRQLSWRETLAENRRRMAATHYPSKRRLRQAAVAAGVRVAFVERRELPTCTEGGLAACYRWCAARGLGWPARLILPLFAQRYMLLRRESVPITAAAGKSCMCESPSRR